MTRAFDRQHPRRFLLILAIVGVAACLVTTPTAAEPRSPAGKVWIGGSCFRDLGPSADGVPRYGYPHREGIVEIFRALPELWVGDLGSCFDPRTGDFPQRFSTADLVEDLVGKGAGRSRKVRSAGLLHLYITEWREQHDRTDAPFYLKRILGRIAARLDAEAEAEIAALCARRREILRAIADPESDAESPPGQRVNSRDYYRALIVDGYLDLTIVVGNAFDRKLEKYRSRELVGDLHASLRKLGFREIAAVPGEERPATIDVERTVRILGQRVRVRARLTGGARLSPHIRHAVANFVEGVAHADVVLYHGHSNRGSAYCISENHDRWSRFDIGTGSDLERKCYGLKEKPYQIFVLQSCESYERYCRPIRQRLEEEYAEQRGLAGFIGTADLTYYNDLAPRLSALVTSLIEGAPPRTIERRLRELRPHPDTPPLIVRGLLQPTGTFIAAAPEGASAPTEVVEVRERSARFGNRIEGRTREGVVLYDTSIFTQNEPGEIVQVVEGAGLVYGLYADGTVSRVGKGTQGAAIPAFEDSTDVPRFRHLCAFGRGSGKARVRLVAADGTVHLASVDGSKLEKTEMRPPEGIAFIALGENREKQVVALDAKGGQYLWSYLTRKWTPSEERLTLEGFPPHLGGVGVPGIPVRAQVAVGK